MLPSFSLHGVCGVYAYIHRLTGMCYVGSSANIGQRLYQHPIEAKRESDRTKGGSCFQRALLEFGRDAFDVELLEECRPEQLTERERFYIVLLDSASVNGFNTISNPGKSRLGFKVSEVTRQRMSANNGWRKITPETRARMEARRIPAVIAASTGRIVSKETREKLSKLFKGRIITKEQREKISITLKKFNAEVGISEETRKKMSEGQKRRYIKP